MKKWWCVSSGWKNHINYDRTARRTSLASARRSDGGNRRRFAWPSKLHEALKEVDDAGRGAFVREQQMPLDMHQRHVRKDEITLAGWSREERRAVRFVRRYCTHGTRRLDLELMYMS